MAQSSTVMIRNHQVLDSYLHPKPDLTISTCRYRGSFDKTDDVSNPTPGDVIKINGSTAQLLYSGNSWNDLTVPSSLVSSSSVDASVWDTSYTHPHRDIKLSTCPHCAATLPLTRIDNAGICTCEYCGSPIYVY